jgi:hypothetical protein
MGEHGHDRGDPERRQLVGMIPYGLFSGLADRGLLVRS